MAEFTRQKSLSRQFYRVVLNENDLNRLSTIVNTLVERFGNTIEITIVSADGEETITTNSPDFFVSPDMPPHIQSVKISYSHRLRAPVNCEVELASNSHSGAKVSVYGEESEIVSGIFHELERELLQREALGVMMSKHSKSLGLAFIIAFLTGLAIFSTFDFILDALAVSVPNFDGSNLHNVLQLIGWGLMFFNAITVPVWLGNLVERTWPAVEFTGRLSDPNTVSRSRVIWVFGIILLPIVINVFSNFLTDFLR
jgi:hypothetical protein